MNLYSLLVYIVLDLALLCEEKVWGSEGNSPRILSLALDEDEWSVSCTSSFTL